MAAVNAVPEDFGTVSVHLVVPDAAEAMAFYEKVFGATSRPGSPDAVRPLPGRVRSGGPHR
jgi:predicted enzyme related to lactoylglutathione lyase